MAPRKSPPCKLARTCAVLLFRCVPCREVVVPEGVTLTIDPGTVVRFEKTAKGDNRITVRGRLVAAGLRDKIIKFVPKDSSNGLWRGIDFESGGTGRIENCIFEKASKGVTDPGRKAFVKEVSFR